MAISAEGPNGEPATPAAVTSLTLDSIHSNRPTLVQPGYIPAGAEVSFLIRATNTSEDHYNINNGFRVWSPDGAEWSYPKLDIEINCQIAPQLPCDTVIDSIFWAWQASVSYFNVAYHRVYFGTDGAGSDTVGYAGAANVTSMGLISGFDDLIYEIPIGTRLEDEGKTICIDSCWFPPGGTWKWASLTNYPPPTYPDWSGPQCFTLTCCVGQSGNVDFDPVGNVDIGDLTALIAYLYIPPNTPPACMAQANVDGDVVGVVDIGDLTALINYLYIPPNPLPAACE
jgi:hypothetical protein